MRNNSKLRNLFRILTIFRCATRVRMRNYQTRLRKNAQRDCDMITPAMRKNAHSCAMVTQQFAIVAQGLRNIAQYISQPWRNIDCAKTLELRDNTQRCATLAQECGITQHYDRKEPKSLSEMWIQTQKASDG